MAAERTLSLCSRAFAQNCRPARRSTMQKAAMSPAIRPTVLPKRKTRPEQSDFVILAVGESADMSGEAASRSSLDLPGRQLELIQAIHSIGKPYAVVLMNGRPLSINWVASNSPAILETWFAGTEGGNAIADTLFGDANPGGKLPVTFPRSVGQVPIYYNHKNTGRPRRQRSEIRIAVYRHAVDAALSVRLRLELYAIQAFRTPVSEARIRPDGSEVVALTSKTPATAPGMKWCNCTSMTSLQA